LLLLPLDIGVRRLLLRSSDFRAAVAWTQTRLLRGPAAGSAADPTLVRLSEAKRRATLSSELRASRPERPVTRSPDPRMSSAGNNQEPPAPPPSRPADTAAEDSLARLREARDRARRRARGEE